MKVIGLRLTLRTALLAVVFSAAGHAADRGALAGQGGLEAKLEYCKTCHGLSGQGYLGYFPMPRLAGQQTQYIQNQLRGLNGKFAGYLNVSTRECDTLYLADVF